MHKPLATKPLRIVSEQVEPTMGMIMLHLFSRVEAARSTGDDAIILNECNHLWEGMRAIQMVAICLRHGDGCDCVHFSIAAGNELRKAADYIQDLTGIDPYKDWWR